MLISSSASPSGDRKPSVSHFAASPEPQSYVVVAVCRFALELLVRGYEAETKKCFQAGDLTLLQSIKVLGFSQLVLHQT